MERIYIVKGIARHFTGDCEVYIVGARRTEAEARMLGHQWSVDKREEYKYNGLNYQTSFEIISTYLQ